MLCINDNLWRFKNLLSEIFVYTQTFLRNRLREKIVLSNITITNTIIFGSFILYQTTAVMSFLCSSSLTFYIWQSGISDLLNIRPLLVVTVLISFKIGLCQVTQQLNSIAVFYVRYIHQTFLYEITKKIQNTKFFLFLYIILYDGVQYKQDFKIIFFF